MPRHGDHGHGRRGEHGERGFGPPFGAGFGGFASGFGPGGPGGPPPWLTDLFGQSGPGSRRSAGRGGPKVRRGDVRSAIIDVLHHASEPINGYQVIQQIAERSRDAWRPSPGSVYPTIQQLQDEGLVDFDEGRGRRTLRLTEDGERYCTDHADELAALWAPFDRESRHPGSDFSDLKPEIGQVMSAIWQIVTTGSERQRRAAVDILVETRRKLYGVLADGHDAEPDLDDEEPR